MDGRTTPDRPDDAAGLGDVAAPATASVARKRTHFGLANRRAHALAGVLGVGLLALAVWHAPLEWAGPMNASAAVPPSAAQLNGGDMPMRAAEPAASRWAAQSNDLLAVASGPSSALDGRLMRIYGLIAQSDAAAALEEARRLAGEFPGYGLAQLVYADLLAASTSTREFASPEAPLSSAAGERLRELMAEARARVMAAGQRPAQGLVPAQFVRLDPTVRHAIAVDVSRSRVYVLENTAAGLVVKRDYYASVGKLGMSKQFEGDLRTPLGVYFVTGRIPSARLHERYGATALSLNYPNQYDQLKGRTGSGIWLHGIESNLFTRAPLATDGCVALANPDLLDLAPFIERQITPVLIADRIQWVDAPTVTQRSAAFVKTFQAWQAAREAADLAGQAKFYADSVEAADGVTTGRSRLSGDRPVVATHARIDAVSMLSWQDQGNVMVVTYQEKPSSGSRGRTKRQYWREEGGTWQVLYEGALS